MIYLSYAEIPNDISKTDLYNAVLSRFSNPQNQEYINHIYTRSNNDSIKESLFALIVLSELLTKYELDENTRSNLIFSRSENGKPYFVNSHLKFNISHSHGYVACALSDTCEVGIDIEENDRCAIKAKKIAKRFFTDEEIEMVDSNADDFIEIWCKKEAAAKLYGVSLAVYIANQKRSSDKVKEKTNRLSFQVRCWNNNVIALCYRDPNESVTTVIIE